MLFWVRKRAYSLRATHYRYRRRGTEDLLLEGGHFLSFHKSVLSEHSNGIYQDGTHNIVKHYLQCMSRAGHITRTDEGTWHSGSHVADPDPSIPLSAVQQNCPSRAYKCVVLPAVLDFECVYATGVARNRVRLQRVGATVPDSVQQIIFRVEVSLVGPHIGPRWLEADLKLDCLDFQRRRILIFLVERKVPKAAAEFWVRYSVRIWSAGADSVR